MMSKLDIATCDSFGRVEPLDNNLLESAVHRQHVGGGGIYKYSKVSEVGATLFYGIVMAHAFENGNKRTGVVSLLVFLDMNKFLLVDTSEDDIYELARSVAAHDIEIQADVRRDSDTEVAAIGRWITARSRERILGDRIVKFKELKEILEDLGCTFDKHDKNYIKIRRNSLSVKIGFPRSDFDVCIEDMKKVRKHLRLSELDGIDSSGFYDFEGRVDSFVNKYRNLLKRLADL